MSEKPAFQINIPEPCHENWDQMTPTTQGAFCKVCSKDVVDFTTYSDQELIAYFDNQANLNTANPISTPQTCGKMKKVQVGADLTKNPSASLAYAGWISKKQQYPHSNSSFYRKATAFTLFLLASSTLFMKKALAQTSANKNNTKNIPSKVDKKELTLTISGVVIDSTHKEPIPYANIIVFKNDKRVHTANSDFDGKFKLKLNKSDFENDSLVIRIRHIGYRLITLRNSFKKDGKIDLASRKNLVIALPSDGSKTLEPLEVFIKRDLLIRGGDWVGVVTSGLMYNQQSRYRSLNQVKNFHYEMKQEQPKESVKERIYQEY